MKKEIMEKWVAALRSGEYKQTTGELKNFVGHCCLGVLCELAVEEDIVSYDPYFRSFEGTKSTLPRKVLSWANLKWSNPTIPETDHEGFNISLAELNDTGSSFEKIADIIEKYYKEL